MLDTTQLIYRGFLAQYNQFLPETTLMIRVLIVNQMCEVAACKNQNDELKDAKMETGDNCGSDARSTLIQ